MASPKRPLAVFTIVQHEPIFYPIWFQHYARQADPRDIYVLYHALPDDAVDLPGWLYHSGKRFRPSLAGSRAPTIVPVHHELSFDHEWLLRTVQAFQKFLLQSYDWVLFSEADELVVTADYPKRDLMQFVRDVPKATWTEIYAADGYEVVHDRLREPVLHIGAPSLTQRSKWYRSNMYSKPVLARIPTPWCRGFHWLDKADPRAASCATIHTGLVLIHLKKMDFELAMSRVRDTGRRQWPQADIISKQGWQNRIADPEAMGAYFDTNLDTGEPLTTLVPIPKQYRDLG